MTLENANTIRKLLNFRDELISQLNKLRDCDNISGNINSGQNGLGFKWDKDSRQMKYLIEGTNQEIFNIEQAILEFE